MAIAYRATLSVVSVTDSLTLSWVDLVESGVMCSLVSEELSVMSSDGGEGQRTVGQILAAGVSHDD